MIVVNSLITWAQYPVSYQIGESWWEGPSWTLHMYWATLSMAIISMRTELVSSRRVYNVYFLTWRNSYKPSLGMLPPILMPLKKHKYHERVDNVISWRPSISFLHHCINSHMYNMLFLSTFRCKCYIHSIYDLNKIKIHLGINGKMPKGYNEFIQ